MDAQIARLQKLAEAAAGPEGVAIILVADHGEAFGEHDEQTHGTWIFEPTMRIPFIVRPPAPLAEGRVVTETVSNVDVMPTALGLLGQDVPEGLDGRNLSAALGAGVAERGPVYMESETPWSRFGFHPEWAAAEGPLKLFATPTPQLFDVAADPGEVTDLLSQKPAEAAALQTFVDGVQAARQDLDNFSASPEVIEQLAALGYITGEGGEGADFTAAPDARQQSGLIARIERARRLSRSPKTAEQAEKELTDILLDHPTIGEVRTLLAQLLRRLGRLQEAEVVLEKGVEQQPQSTILRAQLAQTLAMQGRFQEAYDLSRTILEQVPGDDLARYAMIRYLRAMERAPEATALATRWLSEDPDNNGLQAMLGELLLAAGDIKRGEELLRDSLGDDIPRSGVHRSLARIAFSREDLASVAEHMEAEALWFPQNPAIRLELGNLYMKMERWDDAAAEYIALGQLRPGGPAPARLHAQALFNSGDYAAAEVIVSATLKEHPDDPPLLLLHANVLEKLGQKEASEVAFAEAKRLREANISALQEEGVPLIEEVDLDPVELDFRKRQE